jgi:hypothetical protein
MPVSWRIYISLSGMEKWKKAQKERRNGGKKCVNSDAWVFRAICQKCVGNWEGRNGN